MAMSTMQPAEVGPGVSATATSSARWRRLLEAGNQQATDSGCDAVCPARTMTFVVGAAPDGWVPERGAPNESGPGDTASSDSRPAETARSTSGDTVPVELEDATSAASRARILEALRAARTGWRFRVVGDELALGALRAILHDAGVLDEEIEFALTAPEPGVAEVLVHCGHCQAKTSAPTGGSVPCSGCGLHLTVYPHFSRRQGAYLGYFAEAEVAESDGARAAGIPTRFVAVAPSQSEPVLA